MRLVICSFAVCFLITGCIGPAVDTCIVLNDLKTKHCVPSDKTKPQKDIPIKAGDFDYSSQDWQTLMTFIEQKCH